jgi:hypothetical protein
MVDIPLDASRAWDYRNLVGPRLRKEGAMRVLLHLVATRLALGLLALLLQTPAWAANPVAEYNTIKLASLRGIASVDVIVLPANADAGCRPPAAEQTERELEAQLQRAGIPVVPSATAYLFVSVASVTALPDLLCGFAVSLELQQVVVLVRDTTITTFGTTWHRGGLGVVATREHPAYIRGMLAALADEFVEAYRDQNPTQ